MRRKPDSPDRKQLTSDELTGFCLSFLQRKFYQGRDGDFSKQRRDLLRWVVLWPAEWFDKHAVTISADQYRKIFESVFMDSIRYGDIENLQYPPAWLAKVIHSHFDVHGDEYYEAAKSVRTLAENAVLFAQKRNPSAAPDPVREMAQAARLIKPRNHGKRKVVTTPKKEQLNLL
jgi:hypothetical protein